jgi:hypothetical protein
LRFYDAAGLASGTLIVELHNLFSTVKAKMIKIKITGDDAISLMREIPHNTCQTSVSRHWIVDDQGSVKAQSVLWLYCWAATGMGSVAAAEVATRTLNRILPISYEMLKTRLDHEWARKMRYADHDIEEELQRRLADI